MSEAQDLTALLNRMFQGDHAAGNEAMAALYPALRRAASRRLHKEASPGLLETNALLNEALARLLGGAAIPVKNRQHFVALVCLVMRHVLIDSHRKFEPAITALDESIQDMNHHDRLQVLEIDRILQSFKAIDFEAYQVLQLRVGAGMTAGEAAEELDCSIPTVNRRFQRARAWLYAAMMPLVNKS